MANGRGMAAAGIQSVTGSALPPSDSREQFNSQDAIQLRKLDLRYVGIISPHVRPGDSMSSIETGDVGPIGPLAIGIEDLDASSLVSHRVAAPEDALGSAPSEASVMM